jgi:hypothetical protein
VDNKKLLNLIREVNDLKERERDRDEADRRRDEALRKWQTASKAVEGFAFASSLNGVLTISNSFRPLAVAGTSSPPKGVEDGSTRELY